MANREEPYSTTGGTAAKAPPVAMDAKLLMAECPEDRKLLKELVHKEDASKMMVVLASTTNQPAAEKPAAARAVMNPLLLAAASFGACEVFYFLFCREDAREPLPTMTARAFHAMLAGDASGADGRWPSTHQQALDEVEEGGAGAAIAVGHQSTRRLPPPDAPLLEGITVEGDTALHVVATHGNAANFLECAEIICNRARRLLLATNDKGDTALHCAARARRLEMASRLIALAKAREDHEVERGQAASFGKVLLRTENERNETALHDAVRAGDGDMVRRLMDEDPDLALFPVQGTSPLYLAISLRNGTIAEILHEKSNGNISYSGPHRQNALHAAVLLRHTAVLELLLKWNSNLTKQGDENGSTPIIRVPHSLSMLLNTGEVDPFYQSDKNGMFPVHVAAAVGAELTVAFLLDKFPNSAGLRDAKGRTFLHVAVEKQSLAVVRFACRTTSLQWILNMQDKDGNTALHLAIQANHLRLFCALLGNPEVNLDLTNHSGHTPLDLSRSMLPRGMKYTANTEELIYLTLKQVGSEHYHDRRDHIEEIYSRRVVSKEDLAEELDKDARIDKNTRHWFGSM
uniref:Uncharacterized protein n=1 Tax=Oryza glumipatula TaxID=40148 RepID=A0A0E0BRD2_9ORYZ